MTAAELILPEKPEGWTRRMEMHLNFGDAGGMGIFSIFDPDGKAMPFGYQYDTRKGGLTGFTVPDVEGVMNWEQLREYYAALKAKEADNGKSC